MSAGNSHPTQGQVIPQSQIARDPRGLAYPEISLAADGAGMRVRKVLQSKLAAERETI